MILCEKVRFHEVGDYQDGFVRSRCLIEEKIDGLRIMLSRGAAITRGLNNWWDRMPDHIKQLATDAEIDGELHWPRHASTDVTTGLKNKEAGLRFTAFYVPEFDGHPLEHRILLKHLGFDVPRLYGREEYIEAPTLKVLEASAKERGIEGWILKEEKNPYWWRIKLERTYDLIVTGYNTAETGRHAGRLKSLRCSAYRNGELIEVANVSGMNDNIRYAFDPAVDISRVVEVRAQFTGAKGRLRNPRFIRWRDDKPARECRISNENL